MINVVIRLLIEKSEQVKEKKIQNRERINIFVNGKQNLNKSIETKQTQKKSFKSSLQNSIHRKQKKT